MRERHLPVTRSAALPVTGKRGLKRGEGVGALPAGVNMPRQNMQEMWSRWAWSGAVRET